MSAKIENFLNRIWYPQNSRKPIYYYFICILLLPFSLIYSGVIAIRRMIYRYIVPLFRRRDNTGPSIPVCVVGNITVGGTGKTPFVIALVQYLREKGYRPGVISRGYGRKSSDNKVIIVQEHPIANVVGEEPLLIYQKTKCPVVIGRRRNACVEMLRKQFPEVNVIISDDGLQHYALHRDVEIILLDAQRGLGNGFCLPAGPLREPVSRIGQSDFVIFKQTDSINYPALPVVKSYNMQFTGRYLVNLRDPNQTMLLADLHGRLMRGITGIANPHSFFARLKSFGIQLQEEIFPDHYYFKASDFVFKNALPIVMTEKDALKCTDILRTLPKLECWCMPIEAELPQAFFDQLLRKIQNG